VVGGVAEEDVGQGAGCGGVIAGDAFAEPGGVGQVPQEQDGRAANMLELFQQLGPGAAVEIGGVDEGILVEARERCLVGAGDTEKPVGHDSLSVGDVAEDLLDCPLAWRVAVQVYGFVEGLEELEDRTELVLEGLDWIGDVGGFGNVAGEVRLVFAGLGHTWNESSHIRL